MNHPIEYKNIPAAFCRKTGTLRVGLDHVPAGELVTVCAWHDGQHQITELLIDAGYQTSHGICTECRKNFTSRTNPETTASLSSSSCVVAGTRLD